MNNIKSFLKKSPPFYRLLQSLYYGFRKIIESYIFGTRIQEWIWRGKKREWTQEYFGMSHPHNKFLSEKIASYAPFDSILEIGCASGPNLILLAKRFPNAKIRGIDINPTAVEFGNRQCEKEGISNVKLSVGRADNLEHFPDKSFDIAFTGATLMYIGPDKIKKVASEMQRIAQKAIILAEYHSEKENALGVYNKGNWLRNYKKLFQSFSSQIKTTKIFSEIRVGDWGELGYIIEVIL